jgi:hypothetical protein
MRSGVRRFPSQADSSGLLPLKRRIVDTDCLWKGEPQVSWKSVTSGEAFRRIGGPVVPIPRFTYRWEDSMRKRPSG